MDPQLWIVAILIGGAVLYLARSTWRTWRGKGSGCGKGCGCGPKAEQPAGLIPSDQLTVRIRQASPDLRSR